MVKHFLAPASQPNDAQASGFSSQFVSRLRIFEDEGYHICNIYRIRVFIEHGTCDNALEVLIIWDGNRQ